MYDFLVSIARNIEDTFTWYYIHSNDIFNHIIAIELSIYTQYTLNLTYAFISIIASIQTIFGLVSSARTDTVKH